MITALNVLWCNIWVIYSAALPKVSQWWGEHKTQLLFSHSLSSSFPKCSPAQEEGGKKVTVTGMSVSDESQKVCINRTLYIASVGYTDEPFCLNNFPLLFVIRIQGKPKKALKGEQDDLFQPAHKQIKILVCKDVLLCVDWWEIGRIQCCWGWRCGTKVWHNATV